MLKTADRLIYLELEIREYGTTSKHAALHAMVNAIERTLENIEYALTAFLH